MRPWMGFWRMIDVSVIAPIMQGMMIKILPLYVVMALGFIFGRIRPQAAEPLSFLLIYFIVPIVVVSSIANMEFNRSYLLLPLLGYICSVAIGFVALQIGKRIWKDNTPNIFSYACGGANTGYFGVPVALIIFPPEILGLFILTITGFTLFEVTFGYYWVARGHYTIKDSLRKLFHLPIVYAFALGIICSAFALRVPDFAKDITRDFRGFYVIGGALMIGLGLSRLNHFRFEGKLIAFTTVFKFILWPMLVMSLIMFDRAVTHMFNDQIHKIFILLAVLPLPANAVAYAIQLNVQPDRASTQVFLSTVFALFYVPLVMALWG